MCTQGDTRCSGMSVQICLDGMNWDDRDDCTPSPRWPEKHCIPFDPHTAACTFAAGQIAACMGDPSAVCLNDAVLGCEQGYATVTFGVGGAVFQDCEGGACVIDAGVPSCAASFGDGSAE
jgi:hypothetical protein